MGSSIAAHEAFSSSSKPGEGDPAGVAAACGAPPASMVTARPIDVVTVDGVPRAVVIVVRRSPLHGVSRPRYLL